MRQRHVYVGTLGVVEPVVAEAPSGVVLRSPSREDRGGLARLMLDAYRGTIDYEGEEIEEANLEVERHLDGAPLLEDSTLALAPSGDLLSACLLRDWPKRQSVLVAYVMTVPSTTQRGLATLCLTRSLGLLAARGIPRVHCVITEGNVPSERLFAKFGFVRTP
jgi:RimJ/RimL family protein N-acetyltransferase